MEVLRRQLHKEGGYNHGGTASNHRLLFPFPLNSYIFGTCVWLWLSHGLGDYGNQAPHVFRPDLLLSELDGYQTSRSPGPAARIKWGIWPLDFPKCISHWQNLQPKLAWFVQSDFSTCGLRLTILLVVSKHLNLSSLIVSSEDKQRLRKNIGSEDRRRKERKQSLTISYKMMEMYIGILSIVMTFGAVQQKTLHQGNFFTLFFKAALCVSAKLLHSKKHFSCYIDTPSVWSMYSKWQIKRVNRKRWSCKTQNEPICQTKLLFTCYLLT